MKKYLVTFLVVVFALMAVTAFGMMSGPVSPDHFDGKAVGLDGRPLIRCFGHVNPDYCVRWFHLHDATSMQFVGMCGYDLATGKSKALHIIMDTGLVLVWGEEPKPCIGVEAER